MRIDGYGAGQFCDTHGLQCDGPSSRNLTQHPHEPVRGHTPGYKRTWRRACPYWRWAMDARRHRIRAVHNPGVVHLGGGEPDGVTPGDVYDRPRGGRPHPQELRPIWRWVKNHSRAVRTEHDDDSAGHLGSGLTTHHQFSTFQIYRDNLVVGHQVRVAVAGDPRNGDAGSNAVKRRFVVWRRFHLGSHATRANTHRDPGRRERTLVFSARGTSAVGVDI